MNRAEPSSSAAAVATDTDSPPAYLLGNGRYATLLTRCGAGFSAYRGRALYRWTPDRLRQLQGYFLYLRDLDSQVRWSAGFEPLLRPPSLYHVRLVDGRVVIQREDAGIQTRLEVCVAPLDDVELRRLTITNASARARRLDVTSYLELVLNDLRADAAHPAFSKLFVQTAWDAESSTLLAWRRQRAPDEAPLWVAHHLVGADGDATFETDRMRFLGRGRSAADPHALEPSSCLSGTAGNVLDPVFSIRRGIVLEPQQSTSMTALLAAAADRAAVETLVAQYRSSSAVAIVFDSLPVQRNPHDAAPFWPAGPRAATAGNLSALGLPETWLNAVAAGPTLDNHGSTVVAARRPDVTASRAPRSFAEPLQFFNGIGGFSENGSEYVIRLRTTDGRLALPPLPWTNVVANEHVGFIASECGGGYTWAGNSRRHRLTPWSNDPVADPVSEIIYLRDDDDGSFWSATPAPAGAAREYEIRHGFGYTSYRQHCAHIEHELCVFVARHDPVKLARLTLHNAAAHPRRLSVFAYARLVLGAKAQETAPGIVTRFDAAAQTMYAWNRQNAGAATAFVSLTGGGRVCASADRSRFVGAHGSVAAPAALLGTDALDGPLGATDDPCAALQTAITLAPGATATLVFALGEAPDEAAAVALSSRYRGRDVAAHALHEVRSFWRDTLGAMQVRTPAPALDLMVNGWLAYQTMSCRLWGRSALYQSGGAFGFRDQLQDTAALVYLAPEITRAQILLHAAHQFTGGDVLHWWHPPESLGIRTRFADDLLWLPYITAFYLRATGDEALLNEHVRFLTARQVPPDEDEIAVVPEPSGESGTVYEHCCRAIDRSLTRGPHRLPLIGTGDWNDGMNRVGREGRGESVWLGFFLYDILDDVIPICERRADRGRAQRYRDYQRELKRALNDSGWDGAWYRRAYYDNGAAIGSAASDECRIDAIAQAWAVLSGVAPDERAQSALDALELHLVDDEHRLIRLLTPPFDRTPHDPGYIKGYLPGVRENGGQYTHGALWAVRALAEAGRHDRATQLLELLSPVAHGRTPEEVDVYKGEPYVIAADVYAEAPHIGRAGWTWYTGSSGWMLRVALESILGFELDAGRAIRLRPRLPAGWPAYQITWRLPSSGTRYQIAVRRGERRSACVDNRVLSFAGDHVIVPIHDDGQLHDVVIDLR